VRVEAGVGRELDAGGEDPLHEQEPPVVRGDGRIVDADVDPAIRGRELIGLPAVSDLRVGAEVFRGEDRRIAACAALREVGVEDDLEVRLVVQERQRGALALLRDQSGVVREVIEVADQARGRGDEQDLALGEGIEGAPVDRGVIGPAPAGRADEDHRPLVDVARLLQVELALERHHPGGLAPARGRVGVCGRVRPEILRLCHLVSPLREEGVRPGQGPE
jgi:hypothetical protein